MGRGRANTTNPMDVDENTVRKTTTMPIQKAKVLDVKGMPDEDGLHTVRIRVYGDNAPYVAPVLTPMIGSIWVPKAGQDVAVMFGDSDKPWVLGAWYAIDRIENGDIDIPDYDPGDIRLGNESGAHVTIKDNGDVEIVSGSDGDVYIDGVKQ